MSETNQIKKNSAGDYAHHPEQSVKWNQSPRFIFMPMPVLVDVPFWSPLSLSTSISSLSHYTHTCGTVIILWCYGIIIFTVSYWSICKDTYFVCLLLTYALTCWCHSHKVWVWIIATMFAAVSHTHSLSKKKIRFIIITYQSHLYHCQSHAEFLKSASTAANCHFHWLDGTANTKQWWA